MDTYDEAPGTDDRYRRVDRFGDEPPGPINWYLLDAEEFEAEIRDLDAWVHTLRHTYGLVPTILPPLWHRHDELIWELSALHTHWLNCFHETASPSSPIGWHRDFAETQHRLRDWVASSGTRLDRDRPTRQSAWPGEPSFAGTTETQILDRNADFEHFVRAEVRRRRLIQDTAHAALKG